MQGAIDNTTQLVKKKCEANQIDVDVFSKAVQELETMLGTTTVSGLSQSSPVVVAATHLISTLNVHA